MIGHLKLSSWSKRKSEENLQNIRSTIKRNNIHIMVILEERRKKKGQKTKKGQCIFKATMIQNFPNLGT